MYALFHENNQAIIAKTENNSLFEALCIETEMSSDFKMVDLFGTNSENQI